MILIEFLIDLNQLLDCEYHFQVVNLYLSKIDSSKLLDAIIYEDRSIFIKKFLKINIYLSKFYLCYPILLNKNHLCKNWIALIKKVYNINWT
jgi:hypothetical protein